jgi:hypothetical protein
MNKKLCVSIILAALLLGAGIAANGWFVSQQVVEAIREQEAAFLRSLQYGTPKMVDPQG